MKNFILFWLCLALFASKCKTSEPKDFLPGTWGILSYSLDGMDKTADFNLAFPAYHLSFDAKGNFTESYRNILGDDIIIKGTWTLESNNLQLVLVDNNPNSINKMRTFNVLQPITETVLVIGEGNKEYDLRKQ
ncbi:MAG: lipocalin family protein [Bacteroidetes bacterium]|nr:lipocalin family protein [Bacteroidota bacterium]